LSQNTCAFWLQKDGNSAEEYEDAFAVDQREMAPGLVLRLAIADGATETLFSGLWARLLADAYCNGELTTLRFDASLASLQNEWSRQVGTNSETWYGERKASLGASSTFLGLSVSQESGDSKQRGEWRAIAVGDSCLFQIRDNNLIAAFPNTKSSQFDSRPFLLSSNPQGNMPLSDAMANHRGSWEAGDEFFLMTDAVAQWFLAAFEQGRSPWRDIRGHATTEDEFVRWISNTRKQGSLRNDDVTLVRFAPSGLPRDVIGGPDYPRRGIAIVGAGAGVQVHSKGGVLVANTRAQEPPHSSVGQSTTRADVGRGVGYGRRSIVALALLVAVPFVLGFFIGRSSSADHIIFVSVTPAPSATAASLVSPLATVTIAPTVSPTSTETASSTPTPSVTPSPTASASPTPTPPTNEPPGSNGNSTYNERAGSEMTRLYRTELY
jgi:hypothetical protein